MVYFLCFTLRIRKNSMLCFHVFRKVSRAGNWRRKRKVTAVLKSILVQTSCIGIAFQQTNNKWKADKTSPLVMCLNITGKRSTSAMCSFSEKSRTSGSLLILARLQNDGNLKDCQGELGSKALAFYFFGKKTTYSVKKRKKALQLSEISVSEWYLRWDLKILPSSLRDDGFWVLSSGFFGAPLDSMRQFSQLLETIKGCHRQKQEDTMWKEFSTHPED